MIGFLFVASVVIIVALVASASCPSYIEYYTVQKALDADDASRCQNPTRRRASARVDGPHACPPDYVDVGAGRRDVAVVKTRRQRDRRDASSLAEAVLHMIGNASILLEFEARSTPRAERRRARAER